MIFSAIHGIRVHDIFVAWADISKRKWETWNLLTCKSYIKPCWFYETIFHLSYPYILFLWHLPCLVMISNSFYCCRIRQIWTVLDSKPFALVLYYNVFFNRLCLHHYLSWSKLTVILSMSWFLHQVLARDIRTLLCWGLTLFFNKYAGSLTLYRTALVLRIYISLCPEVLFLCLLWLLDETNCDVLYILPIPIVWIALNISVHHFAYLLKIFLPHACTGILM